ncbi:MAG: hypothetical protein AB7K04_14020 [Pseudorhodoplanes sp.]
MSPDGYYWLLIAAKITTAGLVVVMSTFAAQRGGPLVGGIVTSLPIAVGLAYLFLALEHDDQFIMESARASLAANAVTGLYALVYLKLAQRRSLVVCMAGGIAIWLLGAWAVQARQWSTLEVAALNVLVYPLCIWLSQKERHVAMPRVPACWQDFLVRAVSMMVFVASLLVLSNHVGPRVTGIIAVFPVIITGVMIILYRRVGGPAAAAVIAHAVTGFVGFSFSLLFLILLTMPLNRLLALGIGLAFSAGWNLVLFVVGRSRQKADPIRLQATRG